MTDVLVNNPKPPGSGVVPICPHCNSRDVIRKGVRRNKFQDVQLYFCKGCNRTFFPSLIKNVKYPPVMIMRALSLYNLGYTQKEVSAQLARRHHVNIPERTVSSWLLRFSDVCTFRRLRREAVRLYSPEEMVFSHRLFHNQVYDFQLHRAKLDLLSKELSEEKYKLLRAYLEKIPTESFPHHIFQPNQSDNPSEKGLSRSSQMKLQTFDFVRLKKQNLANSLASLGLLLAKTNKERHESIQGFMIANDSVTIACEVPVYLTSDDIKYFKSKSFMINFQDYKTPITGHIDLLQIRSGLIHILDYKPGADKANAVNQLVVYALALASRTKLAVKDFKCAWFDDKNYYEFFPLHAVYGKRNFVSVSGGS